MVAQLMSPFYEPDLDYFFLKKSYLKQPNQKRLKISKMPPYAPRFAAFRTLAIAFQLTRPVVRFAHTQRHGTLPEFNLDGKVAVGVLYILPP